MKRGMLLIGGILWLGFALGFAVFLLQYLSGGAGLQFFGPPVCCGSVLLGLVHLTGFVTTIFISFAVGMGLLAHGVVRESNGKMSCVGLLRGKD